MANRCPSCGGTLRFDIKKQKLVCEYCESEFEPDSIAQMGGAAESQAFGQEAGQNTGNGETAGETIDGKIFTCPNCGGEVFATDLDAVEYCSYCGTFVTLESRLARLQKPSYIMPFTITKEKCLELYGEKLKKAHFLPQDMKVEKAQNTLRSIYIPIWVYKLHFDRNATLSYKTSESWTRDNTEYTQEYTIHTKPEGTMDGIFHDASATLDDRISAQVSNFSLDSLQPYNSSLMAGSYADVADVDKDVYTDDACEQGEKVLTREVRSNIPAGSVRSTGALRPLSAQEDLQDCCTTEAKIAMLPVWFMTRRSGNRLCYAVVNGNTGKMFTEIPADLKKYTFVSFLFSIPLFVGMECFFTFMPKTLLIITAVMTFLILLRKWSVSRKIKRQDNRTDDKGYQKVFAGQKQEPRAGGSALSSLPALLALAVAAGLIYLDQPNDLPYYGGAILCIIGTFISIASMVKAHNLSCSRPIPHFFDRKKGA